MPAKLGLVLSKIEHHSPARVATSRTAGLPGLLDTPGLGGQVRGPAANGAAAPPGWPAGESLPAALAWEPHTPTDRTAVLADVVSGGTNGVMSLETGVQMLQDASYPIEESPKRSSGSNSGLSP
ncbi:hypothetical protein GCM10018771_69020 [Streptomyces cellulosae]|nr:hypothetical protein GCM10018771_69020 [Streptomyces cellulosae]